jgi:hypothetical protein
LSNTISDMKDFFISYNSADKDRAEWIAWQLEAAGYTSLIQAWDFGPGQNFVLAMQKAATEAKRTIAVLSPDYLNANFTAPEWAAAFVQDPTGELRLLIPVRVRPIDLTGLLRPIVYIDLLGSPIKTMQKIGFWKVSDRAARNPGQNPASRVYFSGCNGYQFFPGLFHQL